MTLKDIQEKYNQRKTKHLIVSIIIDVLGMATYLVPFLGETLDIFYAPLSGIIIFLMYRRDMKIGIFGALFGTAEELFVADLIPTATLIWFYTYKYNHKKTFRDFEIEYKSEFNEGNKTID